MRYTFLSLAHLLCSSVFIQSVMNVNMIEIEKSSLTLANDERLAQPIAEYWKKQKHTYSLTLNHFGLLLLFLAAAVFFISTKNNIFPLWFPSIEPFFFRNSSSNQNEWEQQQQQKNNV